jgi:acyl-lipid omega-6 desaturase (Delta-12 desaturase)
MAVNIKWQPLVAPYQTPEVRQSIWQIVNSAIPFLVFWYFMVFSLQVGYWLTLLLAIPTAGFMVRMFIIFHDCSHGSFFKSSRANEVVGSIIGVFVLTPFYQWRHDHAIHHATAGDLDRRGIGDVLTLTVEEYLALPWHKKFGYRIMRNPLILFTVGSFIVFVFSQRFWLPHSGPRERKSVVYTNLALALIVASLIWLVGWKALLLVEIPVALIATSVGVWLFYVQHNFDGTYWERHDKWEFLKAGLNGSSFYKLPAILQWFTGNIGYHHIHHLSPKIPNYKLPVCYKATPEFHVRPLTFGRSLKSLGYRLWDEKTNRLVGFSILKQYQKQSQIS